MVCTNYGSGQDVARITVLDLMMLGLLPYTKFSINSHLARPPPTTRNSCMYSMLLLLSGQSLLYTVIWEKVVQCSYKEEAA